MIFVDLIIFCGFVISFFLSLLLLSKKEKTTADRLLFLYLLITSFVFLLFFASYYTGIEAYQIPVLYSNQLQMPLLFFYVSALLKEKLDRWKILILFLPLIYSLVQFLIPFVIYTDEQLAGLLGTDIFTAPLLYKLSLVLEGIYPPLMLSYLLKKNYEHKKMIMNNYSFFKGLDLRWIRVFLFMELTAWFLYFFIMLFIDVDFQHISIALSSLLSVYLAYFAIGYTGIFNRYDIAVPEDSLVRNKNGQYRKSPISPVDGELIKSSIESVLKDDKIYRDPELSLVSLSKLTGQTTHNLSQIFTSLYQSSFYDVVNKCRVEEVKLRLEEGEAVKNTLLSIAMDSGFNSKASFNRNFKKYTSFTPSNYLKLVSSRPLSR